MEVPGGSLPAALRPDAVLPQSFAVRRLRDSHELVWALLAWPPAYSDGAGFRGGVPQGRRHVLARPRPGLQDCGLLPSMLHPLHEHPGALLHHRCERCQALGAPLLVAELRGQRDGAVPGAVRGVQLRPQRSRVPPGHVVRAPQRAEAGRIRLRPGGAASPPRRTAEVRDASGRGKPGGLRAARAFDPAAGGASPPRLPPWSMKADVQRGLMHAIFKRGRPPSSHPGGAGRAASPPRWLSGGAERMLDATSACLTPPRATSRCPHLPTGKFCC
mmetsp:Transcript_54769/g.154170  ORF Transcript_54769/g.154170 Transcript_54769/m.154170 type:complete len:273 (+) Transcript_54769:855-1673(+)